MLNTKSAALGPKLRMYATLITGINALALMGLFGLFKISLEHPLLGPINVGVALGFTNLLVALGLKYDKI